MRRKPLTADAVAAMVLRRLARLADRERARQVQRYFRETVASFGVPSPAVRALAREVHEATKGEWTLAEAVALCERLLPRPELEAKGVAILVLLRYQKSFPRSLFRTLHGWLRRGYLGNWASVDTLCPQALAVLLQRHPGLQGEIAAWARDASRWVRRASIVAFLKLARQEKFLGPAYAMAARHFASDDDLVQKATGWLLREAGKRDMGRLEAFLLARGPAIPRTALRYAIERFPEGRRRELLRRTRGGG